MNKLYAFFALVFLTACGSPGFEGSWTSADETGVTVEIGETEGVGGGERGETGTDVAGGVGDVLFRD